MQPTDGAAAMQPTDNPPKPPQRPLDIIQKTESYLLMHHYGGFLGGNSRIQGRR